MNIRPLIVRELRAEARRPAAYWIRAVSAGALTALFVTSAWNMASNANTLGPLLFTALTQGFRFASISIIAALAADSISREKREGTLGLLFLTPLNARDVVMGKAVLQLLRAMPILLATVPIIMLPFLLGGIPPQYVNLFLLRIPGDIAFAIAAGMIASVRNTEWIQTIVWAEVLAAAFVFVVPFVLTAAFSLAYRRTFAPWKLHVFQVVWYATPFLLSLLSLLYAARRLRLHWQTDESEKREPVWVLFFSTSEFWRGVFHWNTRKARDRNPIAWLQEYNWTARLTKWGWCALLLAAEMRMLLSFRTYVDYQMQLYYLTAAGIAFSAASSFRRERQTGALELLLVTPISAGKLVWGRLQGVWGHFLPPFAILSCVWVMGPEQISLPTRFSYYLLGAYFCIPVIGFYSALLTSNVLVAWLLTLFFALFVPYELTQFFRWDIGRRNIPIAFFYIQIAAALLAAFLLRRNLVRRAFVLR